MIDGRNILWIWKQWLKCATPVARKQRKYQWKLLQTLRGMSTTDQNRSTPYCLAHDWPRRLWQHTGSNLVTAIPGHVTNHTQGGRQCREPP